jgi:hypothetical protein
VSAAEVLDERMPCGDHSCTAELFESAHRPQPGLQSAVIGFDPVIGALLGMVPGARGQLIKDPRVHRRFIGDDLDRGNRGGVQRLGEESVGSRQVPLLGHQNIDDLAELVDRPVQVDPPAADLYVGFVDKPAISCNVPAGRAASISSGVNRCTHRNTVTWSTLMPRSASSSSTSLYDSA